MVDVNIETTPASIEERIKKERGSPVTTRDWSGYPFMFLLPREEEFWRGKTILDVGSGNKWGDPETVFPGAKIYAVDPELGDGNGTGRVVWNTAQVLRRGIVQEIPSDENMFDFVLSSHAVPQHIFPADMGIAISEMIRVMKPTGEIRLEPCVEHNIKDYRHTLENAGFEISAYENGSDGPIMRIRAGNEIRNIQNRKVQRIRKIEAWMMFHDAVVPEDRLRPDFNAAKVAKRK
jgi:SAM-dependent methyltransferase